MQARYHTPHPGRLGADSRCPESILRVARELDGTTCEIESAVRRFQTACPTAEVEAVTDAEPYCIAVTVERGGGTHLFRAIQFEPLES